MSTATWNRAACGSTIANGRDEQLLSEGEVTLENLGVQRELPPGAVEHLRFVGPASLRAEMRRALRERNFGGRARRRGWVPGQGRLARVGLSRVSSMPVSP